MPERDKLAAVMAVLHFVRGAAALNIEAAQVQGTDYPVLLRRFIDAERFPALAAALEAGVFDTADEITWPTSTRDSGSSSTAWLRGCKRTVDFRRSVCDYAVVATRLAVQESGPGESMPRVATANRRPSPIRILARALAAMTTMRWTRTLSFCSARRAIWPDAS